MPKCRALPRNHDRGIETRHRRVAVSFFQRIFSYHVGKPHFPAKKPERIAPLPLYNAIICIVFGSFFLVFIGAVLFLFYWSMQQQLNDRGWLHVLTTITRWFDPIFFQYNLCMLLFAVSIVPAITFLYLYNMREEKERRLKLEIPEKDWINAETDKKIKDAIKNAFNARNYFGSMITLTITVMLGSGIILLFKPQPFGGVGNEGVDYARGANFLMLGPYMTLYIAGHEKELLQRLVVSLTAFQFGFLGAYIYFLGHLVRSYFTLDLTPNTFVDSSIRMVRGAVFALILSFGLQQLELSFGLQQLEFFQRNPADNQRFYGWLPLVSFFFGFYPASAVLMIEKLAINIIKI